jgi:hypothetical protein
MSHPAPSRATRSNLTLSATFLDGLSLEQSPLKRARQGRGGWRPRPAGAGAGAVHTSSSEDAPADPRASASGERKRPTPPAADDFGDGDGATPGAPEPKRARVERPIDFGALGRKPFPGAPTPTPAPVPATPSRARSVPPARTTPEPEPAAGPKFLDLRMVPGSPWRSPGRKARVTSLPPASPRAPAGRELTDNEDDESGMRTVGSACIESSRPFQGI